MQKQASMSDLGFRRNILVNKFNCIFLWYCYFFSETSCGVHDCNQVNELFILCFNLIGPGIDLVCSQLTPNWLCKIYIWLSFCILSYVVQAQELLSNIATLENSVSRLEEEIVSLHLQLIQERNERRLAEYRLKQLPSQPKVNCFPLNAKSPVILLVFLYKLVIIQSVISSTHPNPSP